MLGMGTVFGIKVGARIREGVFRSAGAGFALMDVEGAQLCLAGLLRGRKAGEVYENQGAIPEGVKKCSSGQGWVAAVSADISHCLRFAGGEKRRQLLQLFVTCLQHIHSLAPIALNRGVQAWVKCVEVFGIQLVSYAGERLPKALEVHNFPGPQEADGISHLRVFYKPQNVVVGEAGFLLRRHILIQIGDGIAGGLDLGSGEGEAAGRLGKDAHCVVCVVGGEAGGFDFLQGQAAGELVHDGGHNLKMSQFLRTHRSIGNVPVYQI